MNNRVRPRVIAFFLKFPRAIAYAVLSPGVFFILLVHTSTDQNQLVFALSEAQNLVQEHKGCQFTVLYDLIITFSKPLTLVQRPRSGLKPCSLSDETGEFHSADSVEPARLCGHRQTDIDEFALPPWHGLVVVPFRGHAFQCTARGVQRGPVSEYQHPHTFPAVRQPRKPFTPPCFFPNFPFTRPIAIVSTSIGLTPSLLSVDCIQTRTTSHG